MTREEALKEIDDKLDRLSLYHSENRDIQIREIDGATYRALIYSKELIERIYDQLEATIEAQEIIIKDKSAYMEAMAQHKTCKGCIYYISRFTPNGEVSYKFCTKEVNRASDNFLCVWHKHKAQP